jgi:hypothetical protein
MSNQGLIELLSFFQEIVVGDYVKRVVKADKQRGRPRVLTMEVTKIEEKSGAIQYTLSHIPPVEPPVGGAGVGAAGAGVGAGAGAGAEGAAGAAAVAPGPVVVSRAEIRHDDDVVLTNERLKEARQQAHRLGPGTRAKRAHITKIKIYIRSKICT